MYNCMYIRTIVPHMYIHACVYIYIYAPGPATPPMGWVPSLYCLHMRSSPSFPVVWWGCGMVLGMYGVYGRSGMACLESMVCSVCMVGMGCMA